MIDLTQKLDGVVRAKRCGVKADKDSTSKQVNLSIDYSGLTVGDILTKAVAHDVIAWQNGQGRKHYPTLTVGQTVSISASRPGAAASDPIGETVAFLRTLSPEDRAEWLEEHGLTA